MLVVEATEETAALGGAGHTAANLAGLRARPRLVGPIGADPEGQKLLALAERAGIDAAGLCPGALPRTPSKTRIVAGSPHGVHQQVLRLDRETTAPASMAAVLDAGRKALEGASALIVADYGPGTPSGAWRLLVEAARGRPVVVDSRRDLLAYPGVTAVTPNLPEAEAALGRPIRDRTEAAEAARALRERLSVELALVTCGPDGMVLATATGVLLLDAHGGPAVDVTGAGDTVTATFALALAAGASPEAAARLANRAASVVVQQPGTVPIDAESLAAAQMRDE